MPAFSRSAGSLGWGRCRWRSLYTLPGAFPAPADQLTFLSAVAAFAIGATLVLSFDAEEDKRGDADDDSPPWWPEFEREFSAYARRPPARRRTISRS